VRALTLDVATIEDDGAGIGAEIAGDEVERGRLAEPFGPTRPTTSPRGMDAVRPETAFRPPKLLETP
jgi:hypothetical protein